MAISFKKLKSPLLAPTDLLSIGKFKGCRICDIADTEYEYLIWLDRQKLVQYSKEAIALIHKHANFELEKQYYEEEVAPYLEEDDIPF